MNNRKLRWSSLVAVSIIFFLAGNLSAQNSRIFHRIGTKEKENTYLGRDLWFTMIQNADPNSISKFYTLYVTSPNQTVVNIEWRGHTERDPINAGQIYSIDIPNTLELTSSGDVVAKAVHIW